MVITKSCSLLFVLWAITFTAQSQLCPPGGVHGAIAWFSTDSAIGTPGLRSRITGDSTLLTFDKAAVSSLNYHPALLFNGANSLSVDFGSRDLRSSTYFTVYQAFDTANEHNIWHISNDQQTTIVLTTDRMADLSLYKYMNYIDVVRDQPKVNVYVQNKNLDSIIPTKQLWKIGMKPTTPQLPIVNFKGYIPEIIAYDRALNSQERLQVASALSLKYGITLTEPNATYLNSAGEKIWSGYDYPQWHRDIAGICRDDSAGLNQSIATSSNIPGLLTVASNEPLNNNSFLLWGDNGKALVPGPKTPGLPLMLQKTWLMKSYGNVKPFSTGLVIDTKPIDAPLPLSPIYWLTIDPSGEGKFNTSATQYIRMDRIDGQGKAYFKNISWDKDGSGKDVWGIIAGQDLMLATVINQPTCSQPTTGNLQVRFLGGQAPYNLTLRSSNGFNSSNRVDNSASEFNVAKLSAGKYFLVVTDAAQRIYKDSFYLNSVDAPLPSTLSSNYELPAGRPLKINAAESMPDGLLWEWDGPQNFQSFGAQVTIGEPGLYSLTCSKNGCSTTQDITVTPAHNNILYDITVFPNPSPDVFYARVTLDKPASVTMNVYDPAGRLISVQKGDKKSNYLFTGQINTNGTYELVFISGLSKTSKRLVIVK
jgi:hypothetical protein